MSNFIPFDIQVETMKRLPIKSLIRFRSVSKSWKSLIDSSKFIKNHHIHQIQTQGEHLFLGYKLHGRDDGIYVSLIDDDTYPDHKFFHTIPESVNLMKRAYVYSSSHGVVCFLGHHRDLGSLMVVLWNPAIRHSVDILVPDTPKKCTVTVVGFGVCAATNDPKLVRIDIFFRQCVHWEVEVFTLSSRAWKSISINPRFRCCDLTWYHVLIEGFVYWLGYDEDYQDGEAKFNSIISFDLKSEEFFEVCLPESLVQSCNLFIHNHNESLAVVKHYQEGGVMVCGVWVMDKVTKSFTGMFTVKSPGMAYGYLEGFKKNGEAIMISAAHNSDDIDDDDVTKLICKSKAYEPSSGHINAIGIKRNFESFFMTSYTETLFLLDQSNSIIH